MKKADTIPTVMDYKNYLDKICKKQGITIDEARDKYGKFTYNQWRTLLSNKPKRDQGAAELRIVLRKGRITAYHSDGTKLIDRIALDGDWKKIFFNVKDSIQPKQYYFLFGESACRLYHENTFAKCLNKIKKQNIEFAVHKYIEGEHPENVMEASSGWMDYAMINEKEYNKLLSIQEEGD